MADLSNVVRMLIHQLDATRSYLLPGYCDEDEKAMAVIAFAESALAAEPPAPAEPDTDAVLTLAHLRRCPAHGQLPANAWACPECLRELREELARFKAPAADGERDHVPDAGNMVAADGEAEELATLLAVGSSCAAGAKLSPEQCRRAAALLREARAQPVPVAAPTPDDFRRWWRETGSDDSGPTPEMLLTANAWAEVWAARCAQPIPQPPQPTPTEPLND